MTTDEAYALLGLERGASRADVNTAWRELAQMLHPDRYGSNAKLRARAEQQMARVNEARDVLFKSCNASSRAAGSASDGSPAAIAHEAEVRAGAAEVARIAVVTQARTVRERRAGYLKLVAAGAIGSLLCSRLRGTVGALGFSISSALVVWCAVDAIMLSSQLRALDTRAAELLKIRDRARAIAREAHDL